MKKIIIPIIAFSLYSCSTTKSIVEEPEYESHCDLNEHTAGYHVHSGVIIHDNDTTVWVKKVDNNDECKLCREE